MPRPSKIGRLSAAVRAELNIRLEAGDIAKELLPWLNAQFKSQFPEPDAAGSAFLPVTEQNLSDWRRGGFLEWQMRRELLETSAPIGEASADFAALGLTSEHFLVCLNARFASHLLAWDGSPNSPDLHKMKIVQRLLAGVLALRRSEQQAERLALDRERFEFTRENNGQRAAPAKAQKPATPAEPISAPAQPATPPDQSIESMKSISSTHPTSDAPQAPVPATTTSPVLPGAPLQTAQPPASDSHHSGGTPNNPLAPVTLSALPPKNAGSRAAPARSMWQLNLQA